MSKILLVEDDAALVKMYTKAFEKQGFEVGNAFNGEQGYTKTKEFKPDLILLDFVMPGSSGRDMLKLIKEDPEVNTIPVIFLTNIFVDKEELLKMGAINVLLKSDFTPSQIVEIVKAAVKPTSETDDLM